MNNITVLTYILTALAVVIVTYWGIKSKKSSIMLNLFRVFTLVGVIASITMGVSAKELRDEQEHFSNLLSGIVTKHEIAFGEKFIPEVNTDELIITNYKEKSYDEVGVYNLNVFMTAKEKYEYIVTYEITVKDTIAPIISGLEQEYTITEGDSFAFENLGGIVTENTKEIVPLVFEGDFDSNTPGTYAITASATDASKNRSEYVFSVIVKNKPVIIEQQSSRSVSATSNYQSASNSQSSGLGYYESMLQEVLNKLPEPITRGLAGISIVNGTVGGYAGMTYINSMTVEIANGFSDSTFRGTVAHELGHIYHLRTGLDLTQEWIDIYNAEWANTNHYGASNAREAFACTISVMFQQSNYHYRSASEVPMSVEYIQRHLNSGY